MIPRFVRTGVALLAIAGIAALGLAHVPWLQDRLVRNLSQQLQHQFGLRMELDRYWLWPPMKVTLQGLRVSYGELQVLSCDSVRLSGTVSAKRPYLGIAKVVLKEPVLRLEQDRQGQWRLPVDRAARFVGRLDSGKTQQAVPRPSLRFPPIRIENGRILAIREDRSRFSVEGVTGTIQVDWEPDARGRPEFRIRFGEP